MGYVQVLVSKVALIINIVLTIALNTWKTCQQHSHDKGTLDNADTLLYIAFIYGVLVNSELLD